jgi:hypothetical protein
VKNNKFIIALGLTVEEVEKIEEVSKEIKQGDMLADAVALIYDFMNNQKGLFENVVVISEFKTVSVQRIKIK